MNTIEAILSRRSIRAYSKKAVERDKLDKLIECAKFTPSARNMQSWHFTVIENEDVRLEYSRLILRAFRSEDPSFVPKAGCEADFFYGAPVVIVVSGDKNDSWSTVNCALAAQNLTLAATDMDLGSLIVGMVRKVGEVYTTVEAEKRLLKLPDNYRVCVAVAVGYAAETPKERAARASDTVTVIK
ncbi:MAG: nitroreductase family protein [Clostridia bacterium]|nr:nitroreductase family protein [Clostridia bacterium]